MSENVFYPPFLRAGAHEFAEWANRQALLLHGRNEAAQSFHRHVFFALKKKSGAREVGRGAYLFPRGPQLATAGPLFSLPGAASVRLRFVSASGLFLPFLFLFCVRDDLSPPAYVDNFWPGTLFPRLQIPPLSTFPLFADTHFFRGRQERIFDFGSFSSRRCVSFAFISLPASCEELRFFRIPLILSPFPGEKRSDFSAFYMYVSANDPLLNLHKSQHTIGLLFEAPPAPPKESRFSPAQTASALAILWGEGGFPERNTNISHWRQTQITDVPCFFADLEGGHLQTRTYKMVSLGCFF